MNSCRYRKVLAVLLVVLVALPLVQGITGFLPARRLRGSEKPVPKPTWSCSALFSGETARQLEAVFAREVGFRWLVVSTVNQFNFSLFGKITGNSGTPIIVGKDHWLYEKEYIRHYTREIGLNDKHRLEFVNGLKTLQDALEARGIAFILVITPSKPEIYPEHLPKEYRERAVSEPSIRAYTMIRPELDAAGVNVFDVHTLFERLKPTTQLLFPKTGTHWSYYGSYLACRELLGELRENHGIRVQLPEIESIAMEPPIGTDSDLRALLNLIRFAPRNETLVPFPRLSVDPEPMEARPNVLLVGDSFCFTLLDSLNLCKATGEIDLLYYFKRHYHYPAADVPGYIMDHTRAEIGSIDQKAVDWDRLMLTKDLVILEVNEILFSARGWGFIQGAIDATR